jgi:hypothetical protein
MLGRPQPANEFERSKLSLARPLVWLFTFVPLEKGDKEASPGQSNVEPPGVKQAAREENCAAAKQQQATASLQAPSVTNVFFGITVLAPCGFEHPR